MTARSVYTVSEACRTFGLPRPFVSGLVRPTDRFRIGDRLVRIVRAEALDAALRVYRSHAPTDRSGVSRPEAPRGRAVGAPT